MNFFNFKINSNMYFFKLLNIFTNISKCISSNSTIYFSQLQDTFLHIAECIPPNCKKYFSKLSKLSRGCQQGTPTQGMKTSVDTLTRISIRHSIGKRATDELKPIVNRFQKEYETMKNH